MIKKGGPNPNKAKRAKPNPPPAFVLGGLAHTKAGRPTVYQPSFPEVVYRLRMLNNTQEDVAKFFGVEPSTIISWCEKYPEFNKSYAQGGEEADLEVAIAMKHAAKGYSHEAEKIFMTKDGEIVRAKYIQHYPPSVPAGSMWLSNRQKGKYRLGSAAGEDPNTAAAAPQIQIVGGLPDE